VTPLPRNRALVALGIVLSAAFAILAHAAIVEHVPRSVGAALSLVPLSIVVVLAARRSRHPVAAAALAALGAAALWAGWGELERHFADVFFVEHAGINLLLAVLFGRTLATGHEPLCARFARLVHGTIPPEVARYARGVTVAWTIFFAAMFALSSALYLGGAREAWSLLANFLTVPLVVAMFVVEYVVRYRVLPHWERPGILGGVRAFTRHFGQPRAGTSR
jgi:uncharacterized membrane protein